jgi:hypothetical protein
VGEGWARHVRSTSFFPMLLVLAFRLVWMLGDSARRSTEGTGCGLRAAGRTYHGGRCWTRTTHDRWVRSPISARLRHTRCARVLGVLAMRLAMRSAARYAAEGDHTEEGGAEEGRAEGRYGGRGGAGLLLRRAHSSPNVPPSSAFDVWNAAQLGGAGAELSDEPSIRQHATRRTELRSLIPAGPPGSPRATFHRLNACQLLWRYR